MIRFRLLGGLWFLLFSLLGCSPQQDNIEVVSSGYGIFRYPIRTNPSSFDPTRNVDIETLDLLQQIYEGLMGLDENDKPVPLIAEYFENSKDGKAFRFHIRKGAKFSSGREIHADDFKWTFERNCSLQLGSQASLVYLGGIEGVKEKITGKSKEIFGIKVFNPYILEIRLIKPDPNFLAKLAHPVAAVLDRENVPANSQIMDPIRSLSAGPFRVKQFIPNQIIQLEPNAYYYPTVPKLEAIEIKVMKDALTCLNSFKHGDVDMTYIQSQDVKALLDDSVYQPMVKIYPSASVLYLVLNPAVYKPFKNPLLRSAIAMCIDRKMISSEILKGVFAPAYSLIPPKVPGYEPVSMVPQLSPNKAKTIMKRAGYEPEKLPPLNLFLIDQSPSAQRCAEAIAVQLNKDLNLAIQLSKLDLSMLYQKYSERQLSFALIGLKPSFVDPESYLSVLFKTNAPQNYSGYSNPEFDKICDVADISLNSGYRLELYKKAEQILLNDCVVIPIYFFRDLELVRPYVKGLRRCLLGHLPHSKVTITHSVH